MGQGKGQQRLGSVPSISWGRFEECRRRVPGLFFMQTLIVLQELLSKSES